MKDRATFRIWRTQPGGGGGFRDYTTAVSDGMVVLDAVHHIQAEQSPDLAVRWNCKAGKCGSWSAGSQRRPRLLRLTRLRQAKPCPPVTGAPSRAIPPRSDTGTDVSWNFKLKKGIRKS